MESSALRTINPAPNTPIHTQTKISLRILPDISRLTRCRIEPTSVPPRGGQGTHAHISQTQAKAGQPARGLLIAHLFT